MPNINEMLLNLLVFQYDMSLDLNNVYYHMQLTEDKGNLYEIILPRVQYWCKRLRMVVS